MAITLISEPEKFQPSGNAIEFVFDSSNNGRCDFRYVMDIYINGAYATRLKAFPDGVNSYGTFRIERVMQDFLKHDMKSQLVGFQAAANSIVSYTVEIRERYNASWATDCLGDTTDSAVLYTSSEKYSWNGGLSYQQFPNYDVAEYVPTGTRSNFLTSQPAVISIPETAFYNLHFLQDDVASSGTSDIDVVSIETFSSAGASLGTYTIANTVTSLATDTNRHCVVGVGPASLNLATLASGTQPVINSSVDRYTVRLFDGGGNQITQTKTFKVDRKCTKYRKFRLWWLNRLGGFDAFTFSLNHTKSVGITKNRYNSRLAADYVPGDRGETVMSVDAQESYNITSNWMSENESIWMETLWTSPEVYAEYSDELDYNITGCANNGGFVEFVLEAGVVLPTGTFFTYAVDDGSPIGMANSGSGFITGFTGSGHTTTVPATIVAGALITGVMTAQVATYIPIVVTSTSFEEKRKNQFRNINHTIDIVPAYRLNIQRQ